MAGHYDSNPFAEQDVNPFAVSSETLMEIHAFCFGKNVREYISWFCADLNDNNVGMVNALWVFGHY